MTSARHLLGSARSRAGQAKDRWWKDRQVRSANAAMYPPPPWEFASFGDGSIVVPPARIEHPERIAVGSGALIHEYAWFVVRPLDEGTDPLLSVGDRVVLNRFVKIVAMGSVILGPGVVLGDHAYVTDVEYEPGHADVLPADRPLTDPQPVVIEAGASLGVGVFVRPGVTIGERAYVGAGSVVTKDVPARSLVVGNPARVVRRYDPERELVVRASAAGFLRRVAARIDGGGQPRSIEAGSPEASAFAAFGAGSVVEHPWRGLGNTTALAIGDDTKVRLGAFLEVMAPRAQLLVTIGSRCSLGPNLHLLAVNGITVEDDVAIADNVYLADTIHHYRAGPVESAAWQAPLRLGQPLVIRRGAWIGANCVVTGGIEIGEGAIVGPCSVVSRDVPAGALVVGNPAYVQRMRRPDGSWEWLADEPTDPRDPD